MIEFFSSWAQQIIIAVIIASIIEMILPNNKNKKYIKMVIGIYILFNIISPFINSNDLLSLDNFSLETYSAGAEEKGEVNQASMDERLQELYIEELEKNIKSKVEEQGYIVESCKVDAILNENESNQGINKILIKISKNNNSESQAENTVVNNIDKVEINVGLDKFTKKDKQENDQIQKSEIESLKKILSEFYEIDTEKINISF